MKKRLLLILSLLLVSMVNIEAITVKNDTYDIELSVSDSCFVSYVDKDSSIVSITAPNGESVVYIVTTQTGSYDTTYNNDFLESFDRKVLKGINKTPDEVNGSFFFSKEDHIYRLSGDSICKTRTFLWNHKAGMIAGFSKNGNTEFIEKCMNDFKSPISMGRIATLLYLIALFILFMIGVVLWDEYRFLSYIYIIAVIVAWYYFHWVLNISTNHFILSLLG